MFLFLEVLFESVVLISNGCSIANNTKAPVKAQVTNEAIYYLLPMKANE